MIGFGGWFSDGWSNHVALVRFLFSEFCGFIFLVITFNMSRLWRFVHYFWVVFRCRRWFNSLSGLEFDRFLSVSWQCKHSNVFLHSWWSSSVLVHSLIPEGIMKESISCSIISVVYYSVIGSSHTMCVHWIMVLDHYFFYVVRCLLPCTFGYYAIYLLNASSYYFQKKKVWIIFLIFR